MRPPAFDQGPSGAPVAGLRDAALAPRRAARRLRWNQPDERPQLTWRVEAREVAEFGDDGDRDEALHTAQGLQGLDDRLQPPRGRDELGLETAEPVDLFIDGAHGLLKDDLLRRCRTHDLREVPHVRRVPVRATDIVQAESEQEPCEPELRVFQGEPGRVAKFVPDTQPIALLSNTPHPVLTRTRSWPGILRCHWSAFNGSGPRVLLSDDVVARQATPQSVRPSRHARHNARETAPRFVKGAVWNSPRRNTSPPTRARAVHLTPPVDTRVTGSQRLPFPRRRQQRAVRVPARDGHLEDPSLPVLDQPAAARLTE